MEKIKYITNKELMAELDRSKRTFSYYEKPEYARFDAIVHDLKHITPAFLDSTHQKRIEIVTKQGPAVWGNLLEKGIKKEDIVFRLMTSEHVPFDPDRKRRAKLPIDEGLATTPFPPYKHYIIENGKPREVGRSHWKGDLETGSFSIEHGRITNRLAMMFMLLVERYSKKGNWRGYCVDENTEALTKRGWLNINQINETDTILSYNEGELKWSRIKSIFRDNYDGNMFHLTVKGMDALVTPRHKFITETGLKEVETLLDTDHIVLMGDGAGEDYSDLPTSRYKTVSVADINIRNDVYYKGMVWCPETEYGSFMARRNGTVYLTGNTYNDEMRSHALLQLSQIGLKFDESKSDNPFAFYTTVIKNCFTRILIVERKNQHIRDDLLIMSGAAPSYTRQVDHEIEQRFGDEQASQSISAETREVLTPKKVVELPKKRGRKPRGHPANEE